MTARLVAVVLLAGAGAIDVLAHLAHLTTLQTPAHVATLVGMVAILGLLVSDGVARSRNPRHNKETRNAVR